MSNEESSKEFLQIDMIWNEDADEKRGMPIIVFEVFFRYKMGERYFNFHAFKGGFYLLLIIRFLFILGKDFSIGYPFHPLDGVLALYVLFSLFHWVQMRVLRARKDEIHSHFIGYSYLFFLGKAFAYLLMLPFRFFSSSNGNQMMGYYFTYVVIEPLVLLAIAAFGYFYWHSVVIGFVAIIGAAFLFYNNFRKVNYSRQRYLDRKDSIIFGEMMQPRMRKSNGYKQKVQEQRTYSTATSARKVPPKPIVKPMGSALKRALKNLDPKLKNLGKKK